MTTGRVSHQQISPIKGQIVIYRPNIGPDSLGDTLRATLVDNHRESFGESRLKELTKVAEKEIQAVVLACVRLRRDMLAQVGVETDRMKLRPADELSL